MAVIDTLGNNPGRFCCTSKIVIAMEYGSWPDELAADQIFIGRLFAAISGNNLSAKTVNG
ncbi:Uncharacterised protein [Vibrio cholerae]|nr:Uncharacterised protein [Vibrio cholerae]CSI51598.1 Uncharacterised protein [Vibrio cholerae]